MFCVILRSIKKNFSLDSRSLALFRVAVALILLVDFLFTRLPYFRLFYTNKGLLPMRDLLRQSTFWAETSSLNFISSSAVYQLALCVLALIFFFALITGYKTKWALLGSWILLASFQSRNFLILNSGDTLLGLLMFWALCLPLGKHFSVESALSGENNKPFSVFSFNSVFFIFQILLVYFFTYLMKTDPVWKTGQAVYYALMLDNFRTSYGDILLRYPDVMRILSLITYYVVENLAPFLFVFFGVFWRFRVFLILLMCFFHLSLGLFLHLGFFSWICMAGWLALLPPEFWERMKVFLPAKKLSVYYDGDCVFCRKAVFLLKTFLILPHVFFAPAKENKQALEEMQKKDSWLAFDGQNWHGRFKAFVVLLSCSPLFFYLTPLLKTRAFSLIGDWCYGKVAGQRKNLKPFLPAFQEKKKAPSRVVSLLLSAFFLFSFVYVIMWNIRSTNFKHYSKYMPRKLNGFAAFFHLQQHWNMFSPKPLDATGWIQLSALVKEEKIDLWQKGRPLNNKKPRDYDSSFPVFRFRKMLENLTGKYKQYSRNYLLYLCDKWNEKPDKPFIKKIELIYMKQKIPPPGETLLPPQKISINKTTCPKKRK